MDPANRCCPSDYKCFGISRNDADNRIQLKVVDQPAQGRIPVGIFGYWALVGRTQGVAGRIDHEGEQSDRFSDYLGALLMSFTPNWEDPTGESTVF